MAAHRYECVTPFKLLQKPKEIFKQTSLCAPLKQAILQQYKAPKLFSSFRPPSLPSRQRPCKYSAKEVPSFLAEFLNTSDPKLNYRSINQKIFTQIKERKKSNKGAEAKITKSYSGTPTPKINEVDSRKIFCGTLYKPYVMKISPRSNIRLYSPSPIGLQMSYLKKKKKKARVNNLITSNESDCKRGEIKILKVSVDKYTMDYAEIIKKVMEVDKLAQEEVENLDSFE